MKIHRRGLPVRQPTETLRIEGITSVFMAFDLWILRDCRRNPYFEKERPKITLHSLVYTNPQPPIIFVGSKLACILMERKGKLFWAAANRD